MCFEVDPRFVRMAYTLIKKFESYVQFMVKNLIQIYIKEKSFGNLLATTFSPHLDFVESEDKCEVQNNLNKPITLLKITKTLKKLKELAGLDQYEDKFFEEIADGQINACKSAMFETGDYEVSCLFRNCSADADRMQVGYRPAFYSSLKNFQKKWKILINILKVKAFLKKKNYSRIEFSYLIGR
ncbi:hypothetical protein BpHYR1_041773 [Brachionus plicatilis]|uniref:Uncharacterized protein n=1 Tax=Brachionus plicatilis TaxID=10195 RepID=A0A3M7PP95_BRAPC|nr:hypothetical protein BpHYR1_041773 [Brachionus plicatilis]